MTKILLTHNFFSLFIRALSDIPMSKPVAGVRVGLLDGKLVVNPTIQEMERSKLDMVIAGTSDAVLMIEASDFCKSERFSFGQEVLIPYLISVASQLCGLNGVTVQFGWVQGYCDFLTEEQLLEAVEVGHVRNCLKHLF